MIFGKYILADTLKADKYWLQNSQDGGGMSITGKQIEVILDEFFQKSFCKRRKIVFTSEDLDKMPSKAMDAIAAAQSGKIDKKFLALAGITGSINEIVVTPDKGKIIVEWS